MIGDRKPYPEYKDSGIQWLGEIPVNWKVFRGKQLFEIRKRIAGKLGYPVLSVTQKGLRVRDTSSSVGQVSQDYSKYQIVRSGEFAMNSMDLLTGGIGIANCLGVTSPDYRVFAVRDSSQIYARYMLHVCRLLYWNNAFYSWGQGSAQLGRWRLPRKRFDNFPFPVPPRYEQNKIALYIESLNRKIDHFIRNRRRLIEVLNEQKQAIINRAVTQGLDPNVPLKPSGIDWLGDIPKHWKVFRLRNLTELRTSNVDKHTKPGETPVRLCNYTDVYKNAEITINMPFMKATASPNEIRLFSLKVGDVLITKDSEDWADIGVPAVVSGTAGDLVCGYHLAILRPKPHVISGRFLGFALRSQAASTQLSVSSKGVTRYGLSQGAIKDLLIAVPPKNEQLRLVQHIQTEIKSLRRAINRAQQEIDLIREYRTRLISDVVTGKVDVRHLAPPPGSEYLEEMVEELEPLDDAAGELEDEALAGEVSRAD